MKEKVAAVQGLKCASAFLPLVPDVVSEVLECLPASDSDAEITIMETAGGDHKESVLVSCCLPGFFMKCGRWRNPGQAAFPQPSIDLCHAQLSGHNVTLTSV